MAQAYIEIQVLLLLSSAFVISGRNYMRISEVFVAEGSAAVLPCATSSPNKYSTAVTWKRIIENGERTVWRRDKSGLEFRPVGQAPQAHSPYPNFGNAVYNLHIERTREEDAGMYQCEVDGRNINKVILHVIKVSVTPAEVFEGDEVTLSCSVTPEIRQTSWKLELNGKQIALNYDKQTHIIPEVSQIDAGNWSCLIENKQLQAKASTLLRVRGILVPSDTSEVVYAGLGSSATLPCTFSDGVLLNNSTWTRLSTPSNLPATLPSFFNISSNPVVSRCSLEVDRSAHIEMVQDGDDGTYRCSGQLKGHNGKLVKVERDIQLVTVHVQSSVSNGKKTLTCYLSDTSHVTSYEWIHVAYGANDTSTFTSDQKSTSPVLRIPKEKHQGEWMCRFYHQHQLLGNVTYQLQMMSGLVGEQQSLSGSRIIMIIGLCIAFLLAVLIMLQIYKNHRRRKMIMPYPAMETIVHLTATEKEFRERVRVKEKTQNDV